MLATLMPLTPAARPLPPLLPLRSAWLPLSEAVLSMAAEHLPSPLAAAPERYARLLPPRGEALKGAELGAELAASLDATEEAVRRCAAAPDAPLVLYVSKMVAVPASALPRWATERAFGLLPSLLRACFHILDHSICTAVVPTGACPCLLSPCHAPPPRLPGEPGPANPQQERFLAFGRVFSGAIRQGQTVQVCTCAWPSITNGAPGSLPRPAAFASITKQAQGVHKEAATPCLPACLPALLSVAPQVLPATYNPADPASERQEVSVSALYLMMGRGLERLQVGYDRVGGRRRRDGRRALEGRRDASGNSP